MWKVNFFSGEEVGCLDLDQTRVDDASYLADCVNPTLGEGCALHVAIVSKDTKTILAAPLDLPPTMDFKGLDMLGCKTLSRHGQLVACRVDQTKIKLYNLLTKTCQVLEGHTKLVRVLEFSPSGAYLVSGGEDMVIRVWDMVSLECVTLHGHVNTIATIAFSPCEKRLVSSTIGNQSALIRMWDLQTKQSVTLGEHQYWVNCVCYSPCGTLVASGGGDNKLKIWNIKTHQLSMEMDDFSSQIVMLVFSSCGKYLALLLSSCELKIWHMAKSTFVVTLDGVLGMVRRFNFSPDSTRLCVSGWDGKVKVYDLETQRITVLGGENFLDIPDQVQFDSSGRVVQGVSYMGVKTWYLGPVVEVK